MRTHLLLVPALAVLISTSQAHAKDGDAALVGVFGHGGAKVFQQERAAAASLVPGAARMMDRVVQASMADRVPDGRLQGEAPFGAKETYSPNGVSEMSGGGRLVGTVKAGFVAPKGIGIASSRLSLSAFPTSVTLVRTFDLADGEPAEVLGVKVRGRVFPKATLRQGSPSQQIVVESERRIVGPIVLRQTAREGSRPGRELLKTRLGVARARR